MVHLPRCGIKGKFQKTGGGGLFHRPLFVCFFKKPEISLERADFSKKGVQDNLTGKSY